MMAPSTSFTVLVAALLITILSYCSAESVYCVTPTATSCSSCPHNSIHCATLFEYAQDAELYFTSNTTMVFLLGDHVLDTNITVANVTRLTMHGESSSDNIATVVRNGSVGFSFTNMVDFNIHSLAFTSYNRSWSYRSHPASTNSALLLRSTQNVKLVNCSFHDNLGTALAVHNTNITLAENSKFIRNKCACQSFSEVHGYGCGIAALNSTLIATGKSFFCENTQTNSSSSYCGGAIWASGSSLHFNGTNSFINNSANGTNGVGGAINAKNNSSLSFSGISNFTNNSAGNDGGAIAAVDNVAVTFSGSNIFIGNTANNAGGAIAAYPNGIITFHGTNNFVNNSADTGGAIYTNRNIVLIVSGTNKFINNLANNGGAIRAESNSSLSFSGTSDFSHNSADDEGGAIHADINSSLSFSGTSDFSHNSAFDEGGAISAESNSSLSFSGTSDFSHNSAFDEGGAIHADINSSLSFSGTSDFSHNSAFHGGVINLETNSYLSFNGTSDFSHNLAYFEGGAIRADTNSSLSFSGTSNFRHNSAVYGGAINLETNSYLSFSGYSNFRHNSANYEGGAIFSGINSSLNFSGTNDFSLNSALLGGAIYAETNSYLSFSGNSNFSHNSANDDGGGIYAIFNSPLSFIGICCFSSNSAPEGGAIFAYGNSSLMFDGSISFTNNGHDADEIKSRGGAINLGFSSTLFLMANTTVYMENNHATLGGAIYVFNTNPLIYCTKITKYIPRADCFFQLPGQNLSSGHDIQLVFKNNSANDKGSVLYGGMIDNCTVTGLDTYNSGEMFDMLSQYEPGNTIPRISSDPFRVCLCENENDQPDCSKPNKTLSVYPGETFFISVVTTGQGNETVPAQVRSRIDSGWLLSSQYIQETNKTCTTLNYTVFSQQSMPQLELYADGICSTFGDELVLLLNINHTCPPGFDTNQENNSCICDQVLQSYTNNCNITNGEGNITRESDDMFWVGYDHQSGRLYVHPHCPFDYCVKGKVVFSLNNTDMQCANNRSGLLCGACNRAGYSLVLGTSRCKQCSNLYLLLLIPFALMGVALVFLLFVCKLTVATGTLSGLVFYANIVGVNRTLFLLEKYPVLSVFIAWLNLDLGIEACFYDGMDAYSKTWLQFVFPVYLWVLVGLMILVSHFSQKFANRLGSNPVSVLATLILLSYAKILRTFITVVSFTNLEYEDNSNRRVWVYDANIDYLTGRHILLILVAVVVFFFLFLPYTLLLLFGQWLQAISHLRLFSWVNSARLKAFMDAYHAPYKPKHRYWSGLLLALRCVLLLVFALNPQQDPNINLLAILVGAGILQLWAWVSGGVYKNWCLDALEGSFVLNLIILAAASMFTNITYVQDVIKPKLAVGYTSISIAFATFIGILIFQIFQQLRHTKLWKKMPKLKLKKLNKKPNTNQAEDNLNNFAEDSTQSGRFDQLREPLLEDLPQPTHSVV